MTRPVVVLTASFIAAMAAGLTSNYFRDRPEDPQPTFRGMTADDFSCTSMDDAMVVTVRPGYYTVLDFDLIYNNCQMLWPGCSTQATMCHQDEACDILGSTVTTISPLRGTYTPLPGEDCGTQLDGSTTCTVVRVDPQAGTVTRTTVPRPGECYVMYQNGVRVPVCARQGTPQ